MNKGLWGVQDSRIKLRNLFSRRRDLHAACTSLSKVSFHFLVYRGTSVMRNTPRRTLQ